MAKSRNSEKKGIPSHSSPKNSSKACLCNDGTYSTECCEGLLHQQGIGVTKKIAEENVQNIDLGNGVRQIIRN